MTREESIKQFELLKSINCPYLLEEKRMATAARREQEERENPQPLTLECLS